MKYDPKKVEKKWQRFWDKKGIYKTKSSSKRSQNYYVLDMFPYPSGEGLHVGHPRGYIATDVVSRFKKMNGFNVLHPMGWDAFGLPAENYALKNKIHPKVAVAKNIKRFKEQLGMFGFTYDWDKEVDTTDPNYYKWTQWIFSKLFEHGLAHESFEPINWCPSCKTGLANEDLEDGKCERCGSVVEKKPLRQWVLKMTDYGEKLLDGLKDLNWPESIKEQQKNWIGRSEGAVVKFPILTPYEAVNMEVEVFTTRLDTIFGCTYLVIAPEHPLLAHNELGIKNYAEVKKYVREAAKKSDLARTDLAKDKTGVELKGIKAGNLFNGKEVPVFVADYVLGNYGTGAVMAVPAHDERDYEFAKKHNLPIKQSVAPYKLDENNPPRTGYESTIRRVVHIILENKQGEVLTLNLKGEEWGNNKPKTLIIGGIEEGESLERTTLREIKEETGYTDVEIIKVHPIEFHAEFFAAHKNVNRYVKTTGVICKLKSEKRVPITKREKELHDIIWVKRNMLPSSVTIADDIFLAKAFIDGVDAYTDSGILINSGKFDGLKSEEARLAMVKWLEEKKLGNKKINYKMRDWVFARQRYWGEPFPLVHCESCKLLIENYKIQNPDYKKDKNLKIGSRNFSLGEVLNPGWIQISERNLPVCLPNVKSYEPSGTGESPLANIKSWVNVKCPKCGGKAHRETNTMPQWAGSSWYYIAYLIKRPSLKKGVRGIYVWDKKEMKKWLPVDLYVGGVEHATRHLLYARFWHMFLYDIKEVPTREPFYKLMNQGLILAEDGRKMSKRWGNVVNPDEVIKIYGADSLRIYEMFLGPFNQSISWSTDGLRGAYRFIQRIHKFVNENKFSSKKSGKEISVLLNQTIKKVTEDIENFHFNTAISSLMVLFNAMEKNPGQCNIMAVKQFLILLSPFAPHITEELGFQLADRKTKDANRSYKTIHLEKWPKYDKKLIVEDKVKLVVQINGKLREVIEISRGMGQKEAEELALRLVKVKSAVGESDIKKIIFIPDKLINIVI